MAVTWITSRSGIPDQGNVDYTVLGPLNAAVPNATVIAVPGIAALTLTFSEQNGNNARYTVQNTSGVPTNWFGNFALNAPLIATGPSGGGHGLNYGPLQWDLNAGVAGFGCQVQANFYGGFTVSISCYDAGLSLLATFSTSATSNDHQDDTAIFMGVLSTSNNIRRVVISVPVSAEPSASQDFAVNNPAILKVAPSTGSITITKATTVDDTETDFPLTLGGLSDVNIDIRNGQQLTYIDLAAGSGYSCAEGEICGWTLESSAVSNGTLDAITVVAGQNTTVLLTNAPIPIIPGEHGCAPIETERRLIRRERVVPHESNLGQWIFVRNFQLDMQPGVGLTSGQGVDPLVHLEVSRDGGMTYGPVLTVSAGALGQYRKRANWWQLGRARDLVFRVTVSDPVTWAFVDAYLEIEPGLS